MTTSDTPETDAFLRDLNDYSDVELRAMTEHARKLERERDEAITQRMETIMQCELYEQERDEARKDAAQLADRLSGLELRTTEELARMERERDEARQQIDDYRERHDLLPISWEL